MLIIPNLEPVSIIAGNWCTLFDLIFAATAGILYIISLATILQLLSAVGKSFWAITTESDIESCKQICSFCSGGNTSIIRETVWDASLVCKVESTKWPVSTIVKTASIDSLSLISQTIITSGFSLIAFLRALHQSGELSMICLWVIRACFCWYTYSIGSSSVIIWHFLFWLIYSIIEAMVVDFQLPVGQVTNISPESLSKVGLKVSGTPISSRVGIFAITFLIESLIHFISSYTFTLYLWGPSQNHISNSFCSTIKPCLSEGKIEPIKLITSSFVIEKSFMYSISQFAVLTYIWVSVVWISVIFWSATFIKKLVIAFVACIISGY